MKKSFIILLTLLVACSSHQQKQQLPKVKNGSVTIAYNKEGNSDTAIVFVHGWAINKDYWDSQMEHLKGRYTVVALDLGGHGASGHSRSSWTIDDFAGDVIALIDTLHLSKVVLVGHSMAGDIVLDAAEKIPEKIIGIIGIDNFKSVTSAFTPQQQQQIVSFMQAVSKTYQQTAVAFSRSSLFPPNYADTTSVSRVLYDVRNMDSVIAIAALQGDLDFAPKEPSYLSQLNIPLHLIVSDYTPIQQDSLKKYCKSGFSIKTIHGTGHYPLIEQPDKFNQLLDGTLDEISKGH
jgi:pimeloyl-ACP methyl ester carboxylesterase